MIKRVDCLVRFALRLSPCPTRRPLRHRGQGRSPLRSGFGHCGFGRITTFRRHGGDSLCVWFPSSDLWRFRREASGYVCPRETSRWRRNSRYDSSHLKCSLSSHHQRILLKGQCSERILRMSHLKRRSRVKIVASLCFCYEVPLRPEIRTRGVSSPRTQMDDVTIPRHRRVCVGEDSTRRVTSAYYHHIAMYNPSAVVDTDCKRPAPLSPDQVNGVTSKTYVHTVILLLTYYIVTSESGFE